jgi:hypothetical protein
MNDKQIEFAVGYNSGEGTGTRENNCGKKLFRLFSSASIFLFIWSCEH